jgi:ABC-2 type transport system ATP-binding protein
MLQFRDVGFAYTTRKGLFPFQRKKILQTQVLQTIHLELIPGELFGIIGPNGSGKTTMAKLLMGVLEPTKGQILYADKPRPKLQLNSWKQRLGFVSGATSKLFSTMTLEEHVVIYRSLYGNRFDSTFLAEKLQECFLADKMARTPGQLSFGERMKCEIILTLATRPEILILDEPTVGLDVIAIDQIRGLMTSYIKHSQCTGFLTSHNLQDIASICRHYSFLKDGVLVEAKSSVLANGGSLEDEYRSIYG